MGVLPSGSGCQPTASAATASSQSGIPNALREIWPLIQAGPVTTRQRLIANEAACLIEYLESVIIRIRDGDVPRRRAKIYRADGITSKHDRCDHDKWFYEGCEGCIAEFAASAIEASGRDPEGLDAKHESAAPQEDAQ